MFWSQIGLESRILKAESIENTYTSEEESVSDELDLKSSQFFKIYVYQTFSVVQSIEQYPEKRIHG